MPRIDREYAPCLELDDPGFDHAVLCASRARLLAGAQEAPLFDLPLARCRAAGLVRARGRQRTDATPVLAAIRTRNRLGSVGEALRHALHALAAVAPDWLRGQWADRYGRRLDASRLPPDLAARQALALPIGADGRQRSQAVWSSTAPAWLREIPAIETLRRVWVRHDHAPDDDGSPRRTTRRRAAPPGARPAGRARRSTRPRPATPTPRA